jgi:hypothetical protein
MKEGGQDEYDPPRALYHFYFLFSIFVTNCFRNDELS